MFERFKKPVVVVGANASGKTAISLLLAKETGSEIISSDSRQIYKHLLAGTSKPEGRWINTPSGLIYFVGQTPYHLVDFLDPVESYNVERYVYDFKSSLNKIKSTRIIICGGSGLYINSLFSPLDPLPQASEKIRMELKEFADRYGRDKLHEKLKQIDPISAKKIHPNNIHRVIRAIEVSILANKPYSSLISNSIFDEKNFATAFFVFIRWNRDLLYKRIKKRTKDVFEKWVEETKLLLSNGYSKDCPGLKSLGYPQIIEYIEGNSTKEETIEIITRLSMQYAKRQNTWFLRYKSMPVIIENEKDFDIEKIVGQIIKEYENSYHNNKR